MLCDTRHEQVFHGTDCRVLTARKHHHRRRLAPSPNTFSSVIILNVGVGWSPFDGAVIITRRLVGIFGLEL